MDTPNPHNDFFSARTSFLPVPIRLQNLQEEVQAQQTAHFMAFTKIFSVNAYSQCTATAFFTTRTRQNQRASDFYDVNFAGYQIRTAGPHSLHCENTFRCFVHSDKYNNFQRYIQFQDAGGAYDFHGCLTHICVHG